MTVREAAVELQCSNRPQHARQPEEQGQPRHDEHADGRRSPFVRRLVGKKSGRADVDRSHPFFRHLAGVAYLLLILAGFR